MGVIYKITTPTGKLYVGKSYKIKNRIADYRCRKNTSTGMLMRSIRKYGWESHKLEIIEEVENDRLSEREIFWIKELNTYHYENENGLNMTRGGEGQKTTWMHNMERRKEQSRRFSGNGNPFYGKSHSEENKCKSSIRERKRAIESGKTIPKWGAEKGRLKIIKPIICYDSNGVFLKEFISLSDAAKELNVHRSSISESCNFKVSGVEGKYVFRYKTDNYPLKIDVGVIKIKTEKKKVMWYYGGKVKEFESPVEASLFLSIPVTTIRRAARYNNRKPIRTGDIFYYKEI